MKLMSERDVEKAVKNIADYYRHSRLYTYLANADDAYQFYIDQYTEDTRLIIQQGFSYYERNEYLVALRLDVFEEQHPDEFHHYFDPILHVIEPVIRREPSDVLFICAAGPSKGFFTRDTYRLVNEFIKKYNRQYTVLTDCAVEIDFEKFPDYTGSQLIRVAGREYFRWPREE